MPNQLVSVMIPTYNRAKYISQAIDSVLAQDYRPLEIIVVDDGSTDETADIVKQYGPGMVKYYYKQNIGMDDASARNLCIAKASGEFLAWLDSDDYYLPGKLSAQMKYLREHPECEIVFTRVEDFFDDESLKEMMDTARYTKILSCGSKVCHATMLARRDMVLRVGPRNETLRSFEDQEWLYRIYFIYNVDISHCLNTVYMMRRIHENGLAYTTRVPELLAAVRKKTDEYMRTKIRESLGRTKI